MKRWLILMSVGCLAFAGVANAAVQMGDTEVDLLGGWTSQNMTDEQGGGSFDAWLISGAVGYFVTDNIQVQGAGMWASIDPGSGSSIDVYGIGGRVKYHFMPTNQLVPYAGVQAMWASVDPGNGSVDGIMYGPVIGARYELNDTNDFYAEYQYQLWSGDAGDYLDDGHMIVFGIVHQFK